MHPNSLANLKAPWAPGEQPLPGNKYIDELTERGMKLAPQAISVVGRLMKDREVHGELVPLGLRFRAAELIIEKTWPKATAAQLTIDGATSLEVHFNFPGGETKTLNGHAETVTMLFDAEGE